MSFNKCLQFKITEFVNIIVGIIYGGEKGWSMLIWNALGALVFIAYNALAGVLIFTLLKVIFYYTKIINLFVLKIYL